MMGNNNRQRKPTTAPQERTHKKAPASAKVLPTSGNQEAATKQSATSLKNLRAQIDEAKNKRDQLKRSLEEKDRLHASTMSGKEIAAWIEEEEEKFLQYGGSPPGSNRLLREQYHLRLSLDRWRKEERPRLVAEIRRLTKEIGELEEEYEAGLQKLADDKNAPTASMRSRWTPKSERRVKDLERVLQELSTVRNLDVPEEDFERLRHQYPRYLVFKAARENPRIREKLLALASGEWRGRVEGLAQEIVAHLRHVKKATVKWDWTHRLKATSSRHSK